jgi:hypothetical protein
MNKMPYFFLILLTIVLVFISIKPEGFDISSNYVKGATGATGATGPSGKNEIYIFTPGNIIIFTLGFLLFMIMIFLIIKLNSLNSRG